MFLKKVRKKNTGVVYLCIMKHTGGSLSFLSNTEFGFVRHIVWFMLILLGFHFLYSALIDPETLMIPGFEGLYLYLRGLLFAHSARVVESVLGIEMVRQGFLMQFNEGGGILVDESCSAVKWFAHFIILMLLFPGPWKHKAWFIPAGIIVTHLVNIIRIAGLAIVYVNRAGAFDFYHDYVFRPFFYLVLFLMWVVWVERFYLPAKKRAKEKKVL